MPLKQILRMEKPPSRKDDDQNNKTAAQQAPHRKGPNFAKKKDKFGRKRSQSFSGINSKFCPPYKYRTRPMLPTKFLLGGNICDPLNLNSLQDEEVNRTVNAVTPKSSPIPTPPQRRGHIEVIIPPNIHDPLNLIDCADDAEYEQQLTSPLKKGSKRRKKKKRTSSATTEPSDADISASEAQTPDLSNDSAKIPDLQELPASAEVTAAPKEKLTKVTRDLKLELSPVKDKKRKSDTHKEGAKKLRRLDSMDKIVSPVVPQPGAWLKRALQFNRNAGPSSRGRPNVPKEPAGRAAEKVPRFRDKNKAYQYGNYNRYYGYRNPNHEVDSRLRCFAAHRHIFEGKDILDIGCNIGHITLSIARDFGAKSVVGIDIDKKLIGIARKNVRHYVNCNDSPREEPGGSPRLDRSDKCFPISMPILYGPVDVPGMQNDEVRGRGFPHNVTFVQGNYVLEDDSLLCTEQPQFDVILCLSITKWLHLNWGDLGLKQAFRRMYAQLKPGGMLILEPQSWASYKHKKTLTETIYKHYNSIEFFPEKFTQYLLSSEVGFAKSEIMGQPHHAAKGFQRPIQVFTRSNLSPSQSQRSYSITPSHTVTSSSVAAAAGGGGHCGPSGVAGKQVYTCLPSPDICTEHSATAAGVPGQLEAASAGTTDARAADASDKDSTKESNRGEKPGAADQQAIVAQNTEITSSIVSDHQERARKCPDKPERANSVTDKREQATSIADKQGQATSMADKQARATSNADHQVTSAASANRVSDNQATSTGKPVNQATSTGKPVNQATSASIAVVNNKCNNIKESGGDQVINALIKVDGHLGTTTGAAAAAVACDSIGTNKRKHTPPVSSDDGGSAAKRKYTSPVKRKPELSRLIAVNRTCTKRKNDQSTTPSTASTVTDRDSTLTGQNSAEHAGETRLDNTLADLDHSTTGFTQSTTGKSTHSADNTSKRYRLMQRTKCMLDNT